MRPLLFAIALAVLAACKPPAPRRVHDEVLPMVVEGDGPARWVDRAGGMVEVQLDCSSRLVEVWCGTERTCERKVERSPVECQLDGEVTVITSWGARASAAAMADGRVTFMVPPAPAGAIDVEAPGPADGWRLELAGRPLGWRIGEQMVATVDAPAGGPPGTVSAGPPQAPPPPETVRRIYAPTMVAIDLALLVTVIPVVAKIAESNDDVGVAAAALYVGGYLLGGPLLHSHHGNKNQVGKSVARRLLYPVGGMVLGGLLGAATENEQCSDLCGLAVVAGGILGGGSGMIAAVIHDWTTAHLDVPKSAPAITPTIRADHHGVVLGVAGRF